MNIRMGESWMLTKDQIQRFLDKVSIRGEDECWPWMASVGGDGRPRVNINGKSCVGARVAYVISKGPIPDGMLVRHKCDNGICCNPKHLMPGTISDNVYDRDIRGRTAKASDHYMSKLNSMQIAAIRGMFPKPDAVLAKRFGVNESTIRRVRMGATWKG